MIRAIPISGGKDSTATAIYALNNYNKQDLVFVFCDTGWEAQETYEYLLYLEKALDIVIEVISSKKYESFEDMVYKKKRFPSTMARFCTEELKVKPMIDWVLNQDSDLRIYQGIRRGESKSRSRMNPFDEYFFYYKNPYGYGKNGKPKTHTYRKKEVLARISRFETTVCRPIFYWDAEQVFSYIQNNGIKPNPLYKKGFSRVGCFPCIMATKKEVKLIIEEYPEVVKKIEAIEEKSARTFFRPDYIPSYAKTSSVKNKKGVYRKIAKIADVVKYLTGKNNQTELFEQASNSCKSVYNICE